MTSFFAAVLRLTFKRRPREGRIDEENAPHATSARHRVSAAISSTLGGTSSTPANNYAVPGDDPLTLFRLMLGITTSPYLGFSESGPAGTRPASNIGLYARVVHSEQTAKDSFKVFSIVINACYFLQIVVAASLTAMGAAGGAGQGITAFGAINTIIAGFLTFLKGSGLPGRLKYYGHEWKKIREYIEQRERDFSRAGCPLDVYEVVETIEKMYANTKEEIEMNTPDSYTSVTNARRSGNEKIGGIDVGTLENLASKLKGFDGRFESLTQGIGKKTQDITQSIHDHEKKIEAEVRGFQKDIERDVADHKVRVESEARAHHAQASRAANYEAQVIREGRDRMTEAGTHAARDITEVQGAIMAGASAANTIRRGPDSPGGETSHVGK